MTEKKLKESFKILPVEDIIPSRTNPRKEFNQLKLNELAESIKSNGVIQPVIVRKNGEPKNKYELVSGERRLKASQLAGLEEIPAIIRELSDEQVWEIQIIENLQRVDIHPLHEAEGFKRVIDSGKYTKELLAAKVGKSRSYISQRIKLNDLTVEAKNKFYEGKILLGHALIIAKLQEKDQKEVLGWRITNTSVEELENTVKQRFLSRISDAPFDPEDQGLSPEMGKCSACHMRSGFDPNLFPELKEDDYCTFRKCYDEKISAHIEELIENSKGKLVKIAHFWNNDHDEAGSGILNKYRYRLSSEVEEDDEDLKDYEEKTGIWIDGPNKGFTAAILVKKEEETNDPDEGEDEKEREDDAQNQLSEANREIQDKRLRKLADHLVIGILKKFNEVREFTLEVMKEIAKSIYWNLDSDIESTVALSLKLVNDEEECEKFQFDDFVDECDDPKLVKNIIMHFIIYDLATNTYAKDFETLKKIAVDEYDLDLAAIEKQIEEELPFEEETKTE